MSRLNRKALQKLILKEFKMLGMAPLGAVSDSPLVLSNAGSHDEYDEYDHDHEVEEFSHEASSSNLKRVSREDCCAAVLCLIECCTCEETKAKLRAVCDDLMLKKDSSYSSC
jgi:hypothetical protein|tara:strand:- start:1138 stop:1473 length:336 start_codon:yes stop_codon:yes gene_type:complete